MKELAEKKIITVIPARMGSSRLPGKPMARIMNVPMIEWVWKRCASASFIERTVVATCDQEIADHIVSVGGEAVMTSTLHERASDRCAEATQIIEDAEGIKFDIVVMVQGDEPMVTPEMIKEAVFPFFSNQKVLITNLVAPLSEVELENPNTIKVVVDKEGKALYLSRAPIPAHIRQDGKGVCGKQVCIIPFKRHFLKKYNDLEPTPLEKAEAIDMLRVLESGFDLYMVPTKHVSYPVDTLDDLRKVERLMEEGGFSLAEFDDQAKL